MEEQPKKQKKRPPQDGFGARLIAAIKRKGLTQTDFALKLSNESGIKTSKQSVGDWCHDRNRPELDTLKAICRMLDESADHLLFGDISKHDQTARVLELLNALPEDARQAVIGTLTRELQPAYP